MEPTSLGSQILDMIQSNSLLVQDVMSFTVGQSLFASFKAVALANVRCECEWWWNHARLLCPGGRQKE